MKKSIIISLLVMLATDLLACSMPGTHNYYLFSTVERSDWSQSVNQRMLDNWKAYAGKDEMYSFHADDMRGAARQKGDALMISYIDHLQKYLDLADQMRDQWTYPTKDELLRREQAMEGIRKYAFSKTTTRLRSQHALLYMRSNMALGMHQTNIKFWEETAVNYINSVYRDMMRNIYAGALLKCNRADEATQIYVEQGDIESLYTYFYKKRSFEAIRAEYLRDANSPAFPFLLQDFANNAQEAYDAQQDENLPGKLFVRDISLEENRQMADFCQQVLREGKTAQPALWQSLRAWLLYLSGDRTQALTAALESVSLEGTQRIKDNARVIRLFIEAAEAPMQPAYHDRLARELEWLEAKGREERGDDYWYDNHYSQVYDRLVHQVLCQRYEAAGQPETAIALLAAYDEMPKVHSMLKQKRTERTPAGDWNGDYSGDFFWLLDTTAIDKVERYLAYTHRQPSSALDRWLHAHIRHDDHFLHELLGTKYLRMGRWQEAANHLKKVPLDFVNTMNITPFMARRDYHVEPWMKRQRIKEELQMPGTARTAHNQKLAFVNEMRSLEQDFGPMEPKAKARRAYLLATLYAQASYAGDCWYLTRYGKSIMDEPRPDEINMLKKASAMLTTAQYLSDFYWREKVYFAQVWLPIDSWYTEEWNDKTISYDLVVQPRSRQYRALSTLVRLENEHAGQASDFVSRCDVIKQFRKKL